MVADDTVLTAGAAMIAGSGAAHIGDDDSIINFDGTAQKRFGLSESMRLLDVIRRLRREDRRWAIAIIRRVDTLGEEVRNRVVQCRYSDSIWHWLRVSLTRSTTHCQGPCWILSLQDVTEEKNELDLIKARAEHLYYTVEMNPQLPWFADTSGRILECTDRWLAVTGLSSEEVMGSAGWMNVTHPDDIESVGASIVSCMTKVEPLDVRLRIRVANGSYRWMRCTAYPRYDDEGNLLSWYGYTEDIHEHVLVEQKIRWTAEHDTLTGLPNRMLFNKRLETAIDQALQKLSRVGLLVLDVDQFKEVNDLLGHDAGDELLRHFAQKLLLALPGTATIARIGGDEFAVLLPGITSTHDLTRHCDAIFESLKESFRFASRNVECRTSIGAALYPDHGQRSSELMKHADLALYSAKTSGRGRLMIFETSMHDEMRRRVAMVNRGRAAVEENAIIPYYQPKVSMVTGNIVGFEALLRWRDRRGRIFTPATISAAFEELDVAEAMGMAMLDSVLHDMILWRGMGLPFGHVAVNAAPAEFRRHILAERVIEGLERTGIPPRQLQLEVTEGVFLGRGAEHAESTIRQLHDYGVNIALDDFGTGFASLSHLRQFPVDTLKIDRSFVSDVAHLSDDAAIVAAIVSLGKNLGMKVVAEGVETIEQAATLCNQGCEYGQGFLFCRPTASQDVPDLLRNWRPDARWTDQSPQNRGAAAA